MKILLFSRAGIRHSADEVRRIFAAAEKCGFSVAVNEEFAPVAETLTGVSIPAEARYGSRVEPAGEESVMLCYGGDGTLLEGAARLDGAPVPVAGINSGRLGFLTSAPERGIEDIFESIRTRTLRIEERSMLAASGGFESGGGVRYALNEISVQRAGATMISVEVRVDGEPVATCHGDGTVISTPTGSTAYSLSAGGPVVAPQCRCLVISPVAPHNLTMRPVVVPDDSRISLRLLSSAEKAFCSADNRSERLLPNAEIEIARADRRIFLVVPHNISFYDTLRNKMMWGLDARG